MKKSFTENIHYNSNQSKYCGLMFVRLVETLLKPLHYNVYNLHICTRYEQKC
jgi:hypothetical protein